MTDNPNPGLRRVTFIQPGNQEKDLGLAIRNAKVRTIKLADMQKCPHYIIDPDHYRADGSCLCSDPNAKVMAEWGYHWDATSKRWETL